MSAMPAKRLKLAVLPALAAAAFGILAAAAPTMAQQPVMATSIWCDKAEQIESVLRSHLGEGLALPAAVEQTNEAAQDPGACIAATAIVVETGPERRFVAGNQMMAVGQFMVLGVVKDGAILQIQPVVWYAARVVAKLTAL